MEYVILGIIIVAVIVGLIFYLKSKRKPAAIEPCEPQDSSETEAMQVKPLEEKAKDLIIPVEELPVEAIGDESKLVEITDDKVLARINNLIPNFAQVGNAANSALQAAQSNGEVLYRAIIPAGAKLSDSKAMEGAVRGIYHGANGIQGHANLVAIEAQNGAAIVANTAAVAMGVASIVVGQYYMTQINTELSEINDGISKISDFQHSEYSGKVTALMADVAQIANFQVEIVENDEVRNSNISQLINLKHKCMELLGQACNMLDSYTKSTAMKYDTYEDKLPEIQNWYVYEEALLAILYKISELQYVLNLGIISKEYCTAQISTYKNIVENTKAKLVEWHKTMIDILSIDTTLERRKRVGTDRVIHFIWGLIDDDKNFRPIEKRTAKLIKTQSNGSTPKYDTSELYKEDVQLISKGGKIYYLPVEISNGEVKS